MPDNHSPEIRSYNMSRIRAKNTKPEMIVRQFMHAMGLRYRLHSKNLPGKPDMVFKKYLTVININGCFWHGHANCKYYVVPKSRLDYWEKKLNGNIQKDKTNRKELTLMGWRVITVWECELKKQKLSKTLNSLYKKIISNIP